MNLVLACKQLTAWVCYFCIRLILHVIRYTKLSVLLFAMWGTTSKKSIKQNTRISSKLAYLNISSLNIKNGKRAKFSQKRLESQIRAYQAVPPAARFEGGRNFYIHILSEFWWEELCSSARLSKNRLLFAEVGPLTRLVHASITDRKARFSDRRHVSTNTTREKVNKIRHPGICTISTNYGILDLW